MTDTIDIRYGTPNGALSNLTARRFTIDDVQCESMEGFLQSLKYQDVDKQKYCCTLHGHEARQYGRKAPDWRPSQTLWWNGVEYDRHGEAYRFLIQRAYTALFEQSDGAKQTLLDTGNANLTHTVGLSNPNETILTAKDFCQLLRQQRRIWQTIDFMGW